jgi:hypothetical protein
MRKNNKPVSKKLNLNTETVRELDPATLGELGGGVATAYTCVTCQRTRCYACGPYQQ